MIKIEELRVKKSLLESEIQELNDQIKSHEQEIELPQKKAEYEGKYFRTTNSYGVGGKSDWYLYSYVDEVRDLRYFSGITFQLCEDGNMDIEMKPHHHLSLVGEEITKEVFEEAVTKFHKEVKRRLFLHRQK